MSQHDHLAAFEAPGTKRRRRKGSASLAPDGQKTGPMAANNQSPFHLPHARGRADTVIVCCLREARNAFCWPRLDSGAHGDGWPSAREETKHQREQRQIVPLKLHAQTILARVPAPCLRLRVRCGAVRCGAVRYGIVWYGMVWHGTVWYACADGAH